MTLLQNKGGFARESREKPPHGLAEAMKLPPSQFRWCTAYHDEKHHPHIHMMVWSTDPKQGYLTKKGIEIMRSKLTNDIFQDELLHLYQQDERMEDEQDEEETPLRFETRRQMVNVYREAKFVLCDDDASWAGQEEAVYTLEQLRDAGFTVAAHQLGL